MSGSRSSSRSYLGGGSDSADEAEVDAADERFDRHRGRSSKPTLSAGGSSKTDDASGNVTRSIQQDSPMSGDRGQPLDSPGSPGEHGLAMHDSLDERDLDFSGELRLDDGSRQSDTREADTRELHSPDAPPTVTTDSYALEAQHRALELEREMELDRRRRSAAGSHGKPSSVGGSRSGGSSPPHSVLDSQSTTNSYLYESSSMGYSATPSSSGRSSALQRGSPRRSTAPGSGAGAFGADDHPGPVALSAQQQRLEEQHGAQHASWQQRYLAMHQADIEAEEERLREEQRRHALAPAAGGEQRVFEFETDGLPDVSVSPPPSFYSLSAASESVASHRVGRPPPLSPVRERPASEEDGADSAGRMDEDLTRDASDHGSSLYAPDRPAGLPVLSGSLHDRADDRTQPAGGGPLQVGQRSHGSSPRRSRPTGANVTSRPRSHRSSRHSGRLSVATKDDGSSRPTPLRPSVESGGMPAARPSGSTPVSPVVSASPVQTYRSSMLDDDGGSGPLDPDRPSRRHARPVSVDSGGVGDGGSGRLSFLPSTPPESAGSMPVDTVDDAAAVPPGLGGSPPAVSRSSGRHSGRRPARPGVAAIPRPQGTAKDDDSVRRDVPPSWDYPSIGSGRPGQSSGPVAPSPSVASTLPSLSVKREDGPADRTFITPDRRLAAAAGRPIDMLSPPQSRLTSIGEERPPSPSRATLPTRPPSRPPSSASRRFSTLGLAPALRTSSESGGAVDGRASKPPASPPHSAGTSARVGLSQAAVAVDGAPGAASASTASGRSSMRLSSDGGGGPPGDGSVPRPVPTASSLDGTQTHSVAAGSTPHSGRLAKRPQMGARKPPLPAAGSSSPTHRARRHGRTSSSEMRTPTPAVGTRPVWSPTIETLPDSPGVLTHVSGSSFFSGDTGLTDGRSPSSTWWPVRRSSAASAAIRAETRSATSSRHASLSEGGSDTSGAASRPSTEPPRHSRRRSRSPQRGGRAATAEGIAAALRRRRSGQQLAGDSASSAMAATTSSLASPAVGHGVQPRRHRTSRRASSDGAAGRLPLVRREPVKAGEAMAAAVAAASAAAVAPAPSATYGQPWTGVDEASSHSTNLSVAAAITTTAVEPLVEPLDPAPHKARPAVAPKPGPPTLEPSPPVRAVPPTLTSARVATAAARPGASASPAPAVAPMDGGASPPAVAAGAGAGVVRARPSDGAAFKRHQRGSPRQVTHSVGGDSSSGRSSRTSRSGGSSGTITGGGSSGGVATGGDGSFVDVRPRTRRRTVSGVSVERLVGSPHGHVRISVPRPPLPPQPPVAPAAPAGLWSSLAPLPPLPAIPALPPMESVESVGSAGSTTSYTCVEVGNRRVSGTVVVHDDPSGYEYTQVSWSY